MPNRIFLSDSQIEAIIEGLAAISRVFWGPDPESCAAMLENAWLRPFKMLSPQMACDPPRAVERIAEFLSTHNDPASLFDDLETSYVQLFISNRGKISAPLYQSCYSETSRPERPAQLMGEAAVAMKRRLEAVGLTPAADLGQMPDHLSIEIEYLYYLIKNWHTSRNTQLLDDARDFVVEVMLPWTRQFRKRLTSQEENPFYALMASLMISLLDSIARISAA